MATRSQLKALALLRLKEAEALYRHRLYDGCAYLCGYVVEMALKARICRVLRLQQYPPKGKTASIFKTHDFDELKLFAALESDITAANTQLFANWSLATRWTPNQRYEPPGMINKKTALEVLQALRESPYGVLTWLKRRW